VNTWWLIIGVPGAVHLYELGDLEGDALDAAVADRSAQHEVPDDWWARKDEGWDRSLTMGEPHPKLLARATTVTRLEDPA
jgi:hypothetical protein